MKDLIAEATLSEIYGLNDISSLENKIDEIC